MLSGQPIITVGQCSDAGRKSRNDDSYGVLVPVGAQLVAKGIAMAIADGMSSSEGAKAASETCVKNFLEDYYATPEILVGQKICRDRSQSLEQLAPFSGSSHTPIRIRNGLYVLRSYSQIWHCARFSRRRLRAFHSYAMAALNHLRGTTR